MEDFTSDSVWNSEDRNPAPKPNKRKASKELREHKQKRSCNSDPIQLKERVNQIKMWKTRDFYSVNCGLCSMPKVGSDHESSERHLKNVALFEYAENRAQQNETHGINITCNVESSFEPIFRSIESRIQISCRPGEEIVFDFMMGNDTHIDIFFYFAQLGHTKHNFEVLNNGLGVGSAPQVIHTKEIYYRPISVKFTSSEIGQYECPIIFSFKKSDNHTLVIKDMVVYVEDVKGTHETKPSPFIRKKFWGDKLYRASTVDFAPRYNQELDEFSVPKDLKKLFVSNLSTPVDAPNRDKVMASELRETFASGCSNKENYAKYFHYLLWYEETVMMLNMKRYNLADIPMTMSADKRIFMLVVPGLSENRPSLMRGDYICVKPLNIPEQLGFQAVVSQIQGDSVYITGLHPEFFKYLTSSMRFDVRFSICRLSLERMHRVLETANEGGMDSRTFPKPNTNIPKTIAVKYFFNPQVSQNPEQRAAVEHILAGSSGTAPYLIHGPPGTGKTVTIVETILQLVNTDNRSRIMVCTDSNMAADHVASQIIKYAYMFTRSNFLLRANSNRRNWEGMPAHLMPYCNGVSFTTWKNVSIESFKAHAIVITTLAHSSKYAAQLKKIKGHRYITHLFIDEAAQSMEPLLMLPVCGLLSPRGTLVLAGDHRQLGPFVSSQEAKHLGLGVSLMERLKDTSELYDQERMDPNYMMMLRNNFRSDPDIIRIPNELFYEGKLRALAKEDPISRLNILQGGSDSRAVVFHGLLSSELKQGMSPSYSNEMEAHMVEKYINALVTVHKVSCEDIGIVTPYIRQRHLIDKWVKSRGYGGIEVGTVEAFQGREKRIIIISTVRANASLLDYDAKYQLGFLVDDKRFNVAITRAKAKCVIIGNPLCLGHDKKWHQYMTMCREYGTYHGFDAEKANNDLAQKDISRNIFPLIALSQKSRK